MKKNYSAPGMTNYGGLEVITQNQGNQLLNDTLTLSNLPGGLPNIVVGTNGSANLTINVGAGVKN
jgi:hypothetical protein